VTPRYVRDFSKWGARRDRTTEPVLLHILNEIRALRRNDLSKNEKCVLEGEDILERQELWGYVASAVTAELCNSLSSDEGVLTSTDPCSRKALEAGPATIWKMRLRQSGPNDEPEPRNV
jgi:peptide-N4-(N-acetyl-beta-glucosaminyl)asparagine amidase